jgi:hypothetical protein
MKRWKGYQDFSLDVSLVECGISYIIFDNLTLLALVERRIE